MSVASRKRDLAIKAAIGASPRAIALEVLGNAAGQVAFGLIVGAAAGTLAARYLRSLVQGLEVAPAGVVTGTLALLFCAGMAACLAPAIRAAGVNPTAALREE
jgi:ABC-type antimicrobial peptide transport system permease subunit